MYAKILNLLNLVVPKANVLRAYLRHCLKRIEGKWHGQPLFVCLFVSGFFYCPIIVLDERERKRGNTF